jgi:fucose 4-O-acetylase-like acetyltransferase
MWLKRRSVRIISLFVMAAVAVGIYYAPEIKTGWLLSSKSYGDLGLPQYGGVARFMVYVTAFMMSACILTWIPKKQTFLTALGSRTLYVYLLHGFFIQFFRETNFFDVHSVFELPLLLLVAVFIVLLLSSKPILGIWQPFIEGKISIIKKTFTPKRVSENT